jgi:hypothetical protein
MDLPSTSTPRLPNECLQATNPRPRFQQSHSLAHAGSRLKLSVRQTQFDISLCLGNRVQRSNPPPCASLRL